VGEENNTECKSGIIIYWPSKALPLDMVNII
jgi:hypothetical protein